ncbi:LuxR family transcriptional regulator [Arthrobacter alpinus]|uniref:response regulator transcription factor n=1 Tax=Arthrobacter alpinus TaxID=656366 RepID=UPI0005CA1812|nr:response regulator transcription factor [Arthrobacter alpinus]ALV45304.1 LuxR family transcriptional regulator [Arthrobacter alpinus]
MRVVICEDEVLLREGIAHILSSDGFEVLASVSNATQLEREVARHSPDLVVTDIRMPPSYTHEGLMAALRIRRTHPGIGVVVVSQHVQRRYATELLEGGTGGFGYLLKQRISDIRTFTSDIRRVAAGGTALDPEVVSVLVARASRGTSAVGRLTPRQVEVLGLMAEGRSNAAIAAQLVLSEKAVVQHASNIYDALGLQVDADDHRRVLAVIRHLQAAVPHAH